MKILFLDQTGKLAGAELVLLDIVKPYGEDCLVGLFEDGPFKHLLEQQHTPVEVLANQPIRVRRESSFMQGVSGLAQLAPLIAKVVRLSQKYDLIYANTPKALVVGAIASFFGGRPLVYHLHDILSKDHFSQANSRLIISLANRFASLVIAVSKASQTAFIEAGGRPEIIKVVYNGFEAKRYQGHSSSRAQLRQKLGFDDQFLVGQFSRLSPWKGQHILLEALTYCSANVTAILVGDALFGEQEYVQELHQQMSDLGLEERVKFLGFRSDVPQLMAACDLVVHTSTAPEPCARVIVEAMLCGRPLVATGNGGTVELVENGKTGWLIPPGNPGELAAAINQCCSQPQHTAIVASAAQIQSSHRFHLDTIRQEISQLLEQTIKAK